MENFNKYCINKSNLIGNLQKIKRYIGSSTKLCAVVKADAYGIGVKNVIPIIDDYVDYYAVVSVMEAVEARGFTNKDIIILGASDLTKIDECGRNNITIAISSVDEVKYINKHANKTIKAHLKINTGMNRFGIKTISELKAILKEIRAGGKIIVTGVYTHFATKAENLDFIDKQYDLFQKMVKQIRIPDLIVHCANSFVATTDKLKMCNMVRVGFSMYSDHYDRLNIKNVVSIKAQIIAINKLKKGESVGYDRTYIARKTQKIAVVSMGYADGVVRNLSNNFNVLIMGQRVPIVGRVCMDCFMVDVTNVKNVFIGSEVTILGTDGTECITLDDIADAVNFSPYEVLLNFRKRRMDVVIE